MMTVSELHPEWGSMSIYQEFQSVERCFADREFLVIDKESLTWGQACEIICRIAEVLSGSGITRNSHVLLMVSNSKWFVLISLALYKLGAVKIPVAVNVGKKEWNYVMRQSDTDYIIAQRMFKYDNPDLKSQVKGIFFVDETSDSIRSIWHKESEENISNEDVTTLPEDVVDIMYTSGSTSWPKGVPLTNQMLLQSAYANAENRNFDSDRRIYIPIPLNHIFGYVEGVIAGILSGSTLLFTKGHFDAEKALYFMEKQKASDVLLVPSMAVKMMQAECFEYMDLSALKAMYCGASVCSGKLWKEIKERFDITEIVTGYGMTELAGAVMQNVPGDSVEILKKSLGKILPYRPIDGKEDWITYKVVDQITGQDLLPGNIGELYCKGRMVIQSYYRNPQADMFAFTADGWMRTGDIGRFDENGYLEFFGRIHDQCKVNGENVSLQFLDEVIGDLKEIRYIETVAVSDTKSGQAVVAFVELEEDTKENRDKVKAYCMSELAVYQRPKYFVFGNQEEWPHTASMKVQKVKLMEIAEEMLRLNIL